MTDKLEKRIRCESCGVDLDTVSHDEDWLCYTCDKGCQDDETYARLNFIKMIAKKETAQEIFKDVEDCINYQNFGEDVGGRKSVYIKSKEWKALKERYL